MFVSLVSLQAVISRHRALARVLLGHVLLMMLLPPTGEFPVCDDGVFAATARDLAHEGWLRISDLPAMSLVTHALWGALFLMILGDSWLSLHLSVVVMAWLGAVACYVFGRLMGRSASESALASGTYLFCPLVFADCYSFMTDVTAASLMLMSFAAMPIVLRQSKSLGWLALGTLGAACYLVRQTALIPHLWLGLWLTWACMTRRQSWTIWLTYVTPAVLLIGAFWGWLYFVNGVPAVYGQVSLNTALFFAPKGLLSKLAGLTLQGLLLVAPVVVWRCGDLAGQHSKKTKLIAGLLVAWVVGLACLYAEELRPYRGYSLYDLGLGYPPTYAGIAAFRSAPWVGDVTIFHALMLGSSVLLLSGVMMWGTTLPLCTQAEQPSETKSIVRGVLAASLLSYLLLLIPIEYVFDRYVLPLGLLGMLGLLSWDRHQVAPAKAWLAWCVLGLFVLCDALGTAETLRIRRVFWETVDRLRAEGLRDEEIDAGNAHLMAYVYEPAIRQREVRGTTFLAGLPPGTYNGYDRTPKKCKLAFGPEVGWEVGERIPISNWRGGELLVLRRP